MSVSGPIGVMNALKCLTLRGWIPLRQMSMLLNYSTAGGIYQRQRGKNAIETVRIGGVHRVYADVVVRTLENVPSDRAEDAQMVLSLYRKMLKQKEHQDA